MERGLDPEDGILRDYFYAFLDGMEDHIAYDVLGEVPEPLRNEHAIWLFTKLVQIVKIY